jgi:type IV secretion system protein TrbG
VPWRPDQACDDGSHELLHFAHNAALLSAMPSLYVDDGQQRENVNYNRTGDYYVVDRLYTQAELTVGTGNDRPVVRIEAEK